MWGSCSPGRSAGRTTSRRRPSRGWDAGSRWPWGHPDATRRPCGGSAPVDDLARLVGEVAQGALDQVERVARLAAAVPALLPRTQQDERGARGGADTDG